MSSSSFRRVDFFTKRALITIRGQRSSPAGRRTLPGSIASIAKPKVIDDIARQIEGGEGRIVGAMIESHLIKGKQALVPGAPLVYGQSITDGCIDWPTTVQAMDRLADAVRARRAHIAAQAA